MYSEVSVGCYWIFHWVLLKFLLFAAEVAVDCCWSLCRLLLKSLSIAAEVSVDCCWSLCRLLLKSLFIAAEVFVDCCWSLGKSSAHHESWNELALWIVSLYGIFIPTPRLFWGLLKMSIVDTYLFLKTRTYCYFPPNHFLCDSVLNYLSNESYLVVIRDVLVE